MGFCKQIILCVGVVSYQVFVSGAAFGELEAEDFEGSCSGPECANEATQVPSLLQKAKSHMSSSVVPEDDDLTDEAAADLVMQELSQIGEQHQNEVHKTLSLHRQTLMLEADEEESKNVIEKDDDAEYSEVEDSFKPPFDTAGYAGKFSKRAKVRGKTSSAVVYYKIDKKFIHIAMASERGFVGVGMNGRNPSMRNADIVVCRDWKGDGTVSARDFHATGNKAPQPDPAEDWKVTESGKKGKGTWCVMHRARVTCEVWEDYQAYNDDTTLYGLVAWSAPSSSNDQWCYHGYHQRTVTDFSFMGKKAIIKKSFPKDSKGMTVKAPVVKVPRAAGSYVCSYHVLPIPATVPHHIIQWRAIWDKRSPANKAGVQHHVDLNSCSAAVPGARNGGVVDCDKSMTQCGEVLLTGVSQYSPEGDWMDDDAGIAVGGDATTKVLISRHFYNPGGKRNVMDKFTRFEIRYTKKLRALNFAMLVVTTNQIEIPPRAKHHIIQNYCPFECTERLKGSTEIRFVGFHMHRAGLKGTMRVVRAGHEIEPIMTVDPWDDAMSAARIKRTVVPGDSLLGECHFKNPTKKKILYGPTLSEEMCVITLSIVGPGSMKMCADIPLGQKTPPPSCKIIKRGRWTGKYRPWPVCRTGIPMTFCPDAANAPGKRGGKPMLDTAAGHSLKFVSWGKKKRRDCVTAGPTRELVPAQPGSCNSPVTNPDADKVGGGVPKTTLGSRADACDEDMTTHSVTKANVIVGEVDLDNLKVSWQTSCDDKEIEFIVEAKTPSQVGWLAVGLIDGGDAKNPLGKRPNSMQGTDIVMLSPGPGKLKNAIGKGYVAPHNNPGGRAQYIAGGRKCGFTWARYKRPFNVPQGHKIKEKGFVYMVAAYNENSNSFLEKHTKARAMRLKTSLFGGRGESYRQKDGAVEPEPEAEPEAEAEKKANKPIESEQCPNPGKTMDQCWAWAGNAGFIFTESKSVSKKNSLPKGCFFSAGSTVLFLNTHRRGGKCTKEKPCICESKHPEPEAEPEPELAFAVKAGMCQNSFKKIECKGAIYKALGKKLDVEVIASLDKPKGCFVESGKAFFNEQKDSVIECGTQGIDSCVCPVDALITKAPAPSPTPPAGGGEIDLDHKSTYKEGLAKCVASNLVHENECKVRAEQYIKKHDLKVSISKFKVFSSSKWPEGCWILPERKRVFFNTNKATQVKCGNGGSWCMCKASFVIAKKPEECTHVIRSAQECEDAAFDQGYKLKVIVKSYKRKLPTACFLRKKKLYFNIGKSRGPCGRRGTACICEA